MDQHGEQLTALRARFDSELRGATGAGELEALRVGYLGRNGELTALRRSIGRLAPERRPAAGAAINAVAQALERALDEARVRLDAQSVEAQLDERIDVTFPAPPVATGSIHPIRRTIEDVCAYFERHGFAVVLGPEIEPEYYAFDALNIPPDHPAREGFDSFFLGHQLVLRPHTSPMQIRTMELHRPPVAVIVPGVCYRRDAVDARHSFQFSQVEGLLVDTDIHLGHLKGMLTGLCRSLFGTDQQVRFLPHYFPFTEPSAEVDTTCPRCSGEGGACTVCGGSRYVELGGAGMVHPRVLESVGYDPSRYSGWAFGFGIERLAMVRYGIDDIRRFYENDPDFLMQLS